MAFGKKLRELRTKNGLKQSELAVDLGVSQSSISNYELDMTVPDIETLKKYSDYFQIPISELFSEEKYNIFNNKNKGDTTNLVINQLSEKLIEQMEERIQDLKNENQRLRLENDNLKIK